MKKPVRLFVVLLGLLLFTHKVIAQSTHSYAVDQSATNHSLRKAFALPNGKSGVITLTGGNRFICTVINQNGSVASTIDFTSLLALQNTVPRIEMNAIGTPGGNIFIVYTSNTIDGPPSTRNARYLILKQDGSSVASGTVNSGGPGTSLNRFFDLATLSNGNIVAVWLYSDNQSGAFRIFSETGTAVTNDVLFAGPASTLFTSGHLSFGTRVAANPQGGFLISFYYQGGNFRAMRFNNSGTVQPTGGNNAFVVDPTAYAGNYNNFRTVGLSNGNYLLFWSISNTAYYKVINASGADVKAKTGVHADIQEMVSSNIWVDAAAVHTNGSNGFVMTRPTWQDFNDYTNPYVKISALRYDLSGNFLSASDLTSYFIGDFNPQPIVYSGQPSGIGVTYTDYKSYTVADGSYTLPPDADVKGMAQGFTIFPLPVMLVSFGGSLQPDASVLLQWTTASEENNKGFQVQRSRDGINFQTIGEVMALPSSAAGRTYQWKDPAPEQGSNFYRLLQLDLTGQATDRGVCLVKLGTAPKQLQVYPNPVGQDRLTVVTNAAPVKYELFDVRGAVLKTGLLSTTRQQVDVSALTPGVYFLRIDQGQTILFEKK